MQKPPVKDGLSVPGVAFFATSFNLHLPAGYDVSISIVSTNTSMANDSVHAQFQSEVYVNGWQFGKYSTLNGPIYTPVPGKCKCLRDTVNDIGPQTAFQYEREY